MNYKEFSEKIRLGHKNFSNVKFEGAFTGRFQADINLTGADFSNTDLTEIEIENGAQFISVASFVGTKLGPRQVEAIKKSGRTNFRKVFLLGRFVGDFENECDLTGLDLTEANVKDAMFCDVNFKGATLDANQVTIIKQQYAKPDSAENSPLPDSRIIFDSSGKRLAKIRVPQTNFSGVYLSGPSDRADLSGINLIGSNASKVNLYHVNLTETRLDHDLIHQIREHKSTITREDGRVTTKFRKNFRNVVLVGRFYDKIFDGLDLRGANFSQATLGGVTFKGSVLNSKQIEEIKLQHKIEITEAIIGDDELEYADDDKSQKDEVVKEEIELEKFREIRKNQRTDFSGVVFKGEFKISNFAKLNLKDADLTKVKFLGDDEKGTRAILAGTKLGQEQIKILKDAGYLTFLNTTLEGKFEGKVLNGLDLTGSDLTKADLSEAEFDSPSSLKRSMPSGSFVIITDFFNCTMTKNQLLAIKKSIKSFSNLTLVGEFSGDALSGLALSNCDLTKANLAGADLTGTDLTSSNLSNLDLTTSILNGVDFYNSNLFKIKITKAQYISTCVPDRTYGEFRYTSKMKGINTANIIDLNPDEWNHSLEFWRFMPQLPMVKNSNANLSTNKAVDKKESPKNDPLPQITNVNISSKNNETNQKRHSEPSPREDLPKKTKSSPDPKYDQLLESGNLTMLQVGMLFQDQIKHFFPNATDSNMPREFGIIIYYTDDPVLNSHLNNTIDDFRAGQERLPKDYRLDPSCARPDFSMGNNLTLILYQTNDLENPGTNQQRPKDSQNISHYTVLNLIRNQDGTINFRYSNSLGMSNGYDEIPLALQQTLRNSDIDLEKNRKHFFSQSQGPTANCGYAAVYNSLLMHLDPDGTSVSTLNIRFKDFVREGRKFLQSSLNPDAPSSNPSNLTGSNLSANINFVCS